MSDNPLLADERSELLQRYGRFYGSERFAVTFTAGTAGDDAKRVTTRGWDKTKPLPGSEFGAGFLAKHGQSRNVAVVVRPSNLVVLECDSEPDLAAIEALGLPQTLTVRSSEPYKQHFYFRPPEQLGTLPFVAFRFESGKVTADSGRYFLAPPSLHPSGFQYAFQPGLGPDETDIVELPEAIYRQLVERARGDDAEQRQRLRVDPEAKVLPGKRRETIHRFASMQRRWGTSRESILRAALDFNREHCEPLLTEAQVVEQVDGAMKYEGGQELPEVVRPEADAPGTHPHPWLLDAADLLAEPDPGPTPFLVERLILERAIVALVGRWKTTKSYALLYLLMGVALGEPAWGLATPDGGVPVVYVCEESGRAALWRRLDALCRGYALDPERLRGQLYVAANARARLDDPGWQAELVAIGRELRPGFLAFDPLARMKAAQRDENAQKDMAVVVEYLRDLRDATDAGVGFVHHTGHQGEHMRGASDLESVWESKLAWKRDGQSPEVTIGSEHREAEAGELLRYRISWDHETRTMRFPLVEGDLKAKVRAYLTEHPETSANDVVEALGTNRQQTLAAVRELRDEGGSEIGNHPGTTPSGTPSRGGSAGGLYKSPGTTSAESSAETGSEGRNHLLDEAEIERLAGLAREWQEDE